MRTRWLSPAGFVLVALCFLLPFVTASCTATANDQKVTATATYTGLDLAVGDRPEFTVTSPTAAGSAEAMVQLRQRVGPIDIQPFAVVALVLLVAGAAAGVIRAGWLRSIVSAAIAVSAAVFLSGAELDGRDEIRSELTQRFTTFAGRPPDPADFTVHTAFGFWIALLLLVGVAAGNIAALFLGRTDGVPALVGSGTVAGLAPPSGGLAPPSGGAAGIPPPVPLAPPPPAPPLPAPAQRDATRDAPAIPPWPPEPPAAR